MKYKNDFQVWIRIGYVMFHLLTIFIIFFSDLRNESFAIFFAMSLFLLLCILLLDFLFFTTRYIFYYTYITENGVKQKLFWIKKEISFSEVKYIYLFSNYAVLSSNKDLNIINKTSSSRDNRRILKKLKHNVIVYLSEIRYKGGGVSNAKLIIGLQAKCVNAQFIKIGTIPQHIDKYIAD